MFRKTGRVSGGWLRKNYRERVDANREGFDFSFFQFERKFVSFREMRQYWMQVSLGGYFSMRRLDKPASMPEGE